MSAAGGPQVQRTAGGQPNSRGADARRGRRKGPSQNANPGRNPQTRARNASGPAPGGANPQAAPAAKRSNDARPPKSAGKPFGAAPKKKDPESMNVEEDVSFVPSQQMPRQNADPVQRYSKQELAVTGPLFADASLLGFLKQRKRAPPRAVPRYMLNQPRLLVAPAFQQDPWDQQNQAKMLEIERNNAGSDYQGIYEEFQKMREVERKKMEELGLLDAENIRKDLNDAIFFQGTCLDMCPTFERVRRALENNVKALEKEGGKISRAKAVKAFSRPAAGQPPPMPSDVRPPHILMETLNYIVDHILHQLPEAHSFIWDRTRSIRQDFIYQNYYGPEAIDCNERIVRIHLLSLHIMAGSDVEHSQQQELEQFNKALQTLTEIYQDVRNHGGACANEAEFRAYHLISHFRDPELEREIQTLPDSIFKDSKVQLALRFRNLMSQNNIVERGYTNAIGAENLFVEFFKLVNSPETPVLLACLLETHFNEIRFYALKSMSRSYHTKGRAFLASSLQSMLGFDTVDQLVAFVSYYEVDTMDENGTILVDLCNKDKLEAKYKLNSLHDKPKRAQAFSLLLDARMKQASLASFVNSGHPNTNLNLKTSQAKVLNYDNRKRITQNGTSNTTAQPSAFGLPQDNATKPFGSTPQNAFQNTSSTPFQPAQTFDFTKAAATVPPETTKPENNSLNLSGFLQNQGTASAPSQFGQFGQPLAKETTAPPSFNFAAKKNDAPETVAAKTPPVELKGLGSQPAQFSFQKAEPKPKQELTPTFSLPAKSDAPQDSQSTLFNFGKADQVPALFQTSISKPSVAEIPKPSKPAPKLLKDSRGFEQAVNQIYDQILGESIDQELQKILSRMIKHDNRNKEREKLIGTLTNELYQAFVAEISHGVLQYSVADDKYNKFLKKKAFNHMREVLKKHKAKQETRKRRMEELKSVSFSAPLLKRKRTSANSSSDSFAKRSPSKAANTSYDHMFERQQEIQKLWEPIDLPKFVELCAQNVKIDVNAPKVELKSLIIAEDWNSPYSKWLNTKFSLKLDSDKKLYSKRVEGEKINMTVESLPSAIKEDVFKNTTFIVFECGLVDEKQVELYKTMKNKLNRDSGILLKIMQLASRYCLYKIQVLVLVWDSSNSRTGLNEELPILRIAEHKKNHSCIQDIHVCDMSMPHVNVSDILQTTFLRMGQMFEGLLTERGVKKLKLVPKKAAEPEPETIEPPSEEKLRAKELEILRKAKEAQKRRYLTKHSLSAINDTVDLTNATANFKTPNASFANNTLVNFPNSFLGNNTVLHAKDVSFLGSFANASIIEESTPSGSPRPKSSVPLPKKLQDLRSLAASVKARYKK